MCSVIWNPSSTLTPPPYPRGSMRYPPSDLQLPRVDGARPSQPACATYRARVYSVTPAPAPSCVQRVDHGAHCSIERKQVVGFRWAQVKEAEHLRTSRPTPPAQPSPRSASPSPYQSCAASAAPCAGAPGPSSSGEGNDVQDPLKEERCCEWLRGNHSKTPKTAMGLRYGLRSCLSQT